MKTLLLLLAFIGSSPLFAQNISEHEIATFWETNIVPITTMDRATIYAQTAFPIMSYDGEWNQEDLDAQFDIVFAEDMIEDLRLQSASDVQQFEFDENETALMVVMISSYEVEEEVLESATILTFRKMGDAWKLFRIDFAG